MEISYAPLTGTAVVRLPTCSGLPRSVERALRADLEVVCRRRGHDGVQAVAGVAVANARRAAATRDR